MQLVQYALINAHIFIQRLKASTLFWPCYTVIALRFRLVSEAKLANFIIINKFKSLPPTFHHKPICFWNMFIIIVYFIFNFYLKYIIFLFISC